MESHLQEDNVLYSHRKKKQTDNESLIINGRYNQQELMAKL